MKHILVAAAVPLYAEVRLPDRSDSVVIQRIYNGSPRPGRITWLSEGDEHHGDEYIEVSATDKIEVLRFET